MKVPRIYAASRDMRRQDQLSLSLGSFNRSGISLNLGILPDIPDQTKGGLIKTSRGR